MVLKGYVKILKKAIGKTDGQIRKMNRNKTNENIKQTYMFARWLWLYEGHHYVWWIGKY